MMSIRAPNRSSSTSILHDPRFARSGRGGRDDDDSACPLYRSGYQESGRRSGRLKDSGEGESAVLPNTPSLLSIIAHARAGALDHACRLFLEGGFELVNDDPAVLSVRGRLLKDRALAAEGAERRRLYLEAAGAYARAAELGGATYPLVNAATLFLLAGRRSSPRRWRANCSNARAPAGTNWRRLIIAPRPRPKRCCSWAMPRRPGPRCAKRSAWRRRL